MKADTFISRFCVIVDDYSGEVDASSPDQLFLAPTNEDGQLTTDCQFRGKVMTRSTIEMLISVSTWVQLRPLRGTFVAPDSVVLRNAGPSTKDPRGIAWELIPFRCRPR